jgi:hypothetical protein
MLGPDGGISMAGTIKRWVIALLSATLALTLASGVAFAGTGHSQGGADDHGLRYGTGNMFDFWSCPDGYLLVEDWNAEDYDTNEDGWICMNEIDGGIDNFIDNNAWPPD